MTGVSVLVPTIRVDAWLDAAVESLLAQDHDPLEVVVVLDGAAPDEHRSWWHDPRVVVVANPRRNGTAHALNTAAGVARHPYLARLDADDIALPARLRTQAALLDSARDVCLVGSNAVVVDERDNVVGNRDVPASDDQAAVLLTRNCFIHSSVMFRSEAFHAAGRYDVEQKNLEDYELFLRLAHQGRLVSLGERLVAYRVHAGQKSRGAKPWGPYVQCVVRRRGELARELGRSRASQSARDIAWCTAQVLRYAGVRRA